MPISLACSVQRLNLFTEINGANEGNFGGYDENSSSGI
jgi:hypothetical protein